MLIFDDMANTLAIPKRNGLLASTQTGMADELTQPLKCTKPTVRKRLALLFKPLLAF
jgi:hypothetical protein